MSTLVTGGTGFIGRYVLDRLEDRGEDVVSYDRAPSGAGLPVSVTSVQGELFDLSRLAATVTEHDVRRIVHAAGMSDPLLSTGMPVATVAANAFGTLNVLEAARLAGVRGRVVLLSSTTVYGDDDPEPDGRPPLRPQTPYAASKAFGDMLGQVYTHSYGLDVVSLRFAEAYGPGRQLPSVLQRILDAALERRPLRLVEGPDRPYRLVHVEDASRAIVAALDAPSPTTRIYDITGERVVLAQIVAIVRDRLPQADIEVGSGSVASFDSQGPIAVTAAARELGYRPRWGLARGIDDFCAWREAEEAC
jgi:nucleoside-diphosphate-sugar epimerase